VRVALRSPRLFGCLKNDRSPRLFGCLKNDRSPRLFGCLKNDRSPRLLSRHLAEEAGVEVSRAHLWRILHEADIVYKRPKAAVRGPDPGYEAEKRREGRLQEGLQGPG